MNALAKTVLWGVCAILKKTQYLQTSTVDCKICKPIILRKNMLHDFLLKECQDTKLRS